MRLGVQRKRRFVIGKRDIFRSVIAERKLGGGIIPACPGVDVCKSKRTFRLLQSGNNSIFARDLSLALRVGKKFPAIRTFPIFDIAVFAHFRLDAGNFDERMLVRRLRAARQYNGKQHRQQCTQNFFS